jgi:AcrR family transcriptional regulator
MPKRVDQAERRAHIVEALLAIVGQRGIDAVSLREVAQEAGVSMGAVQHYFASKDEMLSYALEHWLTLSVHQRFSQRIRDRAGVTGPPGTAGHDGPPAAAPATLLRALAAEFLPHDEETRADVRVALAFIERAAAQPELARAMRGAFTGFKETLQALLAASDPGLDASAEGLRLAALLEGLRYAVLLGALPHRSAMAAVTRHLEGIGIGIQAG